MITTTPPLNYWPQTATAKAFWGQQELLPYKQLLRATLAWLQPQPAERWLDLGCGGGALTKGLWLASRGSVGEIVGLDCAAANARAYAKHRVRLTPPPGDRLRFIAADFSDGLPFSQDNQFDGVVSGLAIQYAESYSTQEGRWTTAGYDRLLAEVFRVLKPGGRFVFSVNVPEPSWLKVALYSVPGAFLSRRPLRFLQKAWAMYRYGGWLKREARKGRFHYLPRDVVMAKLEAAGYVNIERQRSFAGQAYVFRGWKPSLA
jgi:ubiquinone/menaquinone biosynthesis C-methylase UbiE